jgi:hypothetical protein
MPAPRLSQLVALLSAANRSGGMLDMPPLSVDEVEPLQQRAAAALGHRLPEAYIAFLRLMDGAYAGSLSIAGSRERPLRYADGREHRSVFVPEVIEEVQELQWDSELFLFVYGDFVRGWNPDTGEWVLLTHQQEPMRTYESFEALLADALWDASIDTRPLMPMTFEYFSLDASGNKVRGTAS